jgi:hypothetical protein
VAATSNNQTTGYCYDADFYPFGGERPVVASSGNNYKFTSKERDPESGLYRGSRTDGLFQHAIKALPQGSYSKQIFFPLAMCECLRKSSSLR